MKLGMRRIVAAVAVGVGVMAGVGMWFWPRRQELSVDYRMPGNPQPKIDAAKAAAIERRERVIDQTVWKKEMEAQEYGRVFEDFWDALNAATNKWAVLEGFLFEGINWGEGRVKESLPHGIERWVSADDLAGEKRKGDRGRGAASSSEGKQVSKPAIRQTRRSALRGEWLENVAKWKAAGWEIMQCEFRHNAFDPQTNDVPARSRFYFSAHLTNPAPARAVVEGDLLVEWARRETNQEAPRVAKIDASGLRVLFRAGPAAFLEIMTATFDPPDLSTAIEPLLAYDLDDDEVPEIAMPAVNRMWRRRGDSYAEEKFCSTERMQVLNGMFVDFDRDGVTDFLFVEFNGVFLLKGERGGAFRTEPRLLANKAEEFWGPRAMTCADIDGDGDLDVFIGQYKGPFTGGSMPTPYYDANDGYKSFLFINDGAGNLKDGTVERGLGAKRLRRVYSASFVDLDEDGALDLVVVSDFAGVDVFKNDGRGKFTDVTAEWIDEPRAFGMGNAFGDFNNDGRLDLYVTGMTSATANRLEHLGLQRANSNFDPAMRGRMSFGSRLYLAAGPGDEVASGREKNRISSRRFLQGGGETARTGWSWGVSAADFDNDGWLDLYVGNGMESMRSVRDYEGEMWLHDVFVGTSVERSGEKLYFQLKGSARRRALESFGGFDKNRLLLNRNGKEFVNVAHLLGVALEDDCRNVVATDLDGDGDADLVLTTQQSMAPMKERLRIFRNDLAPQGNWIAFAFEEKAGHQPLAGTRVILEAGGARKAGALVNGDSFRSQHPARVSFGLGKVGKVEEAEIHWPGGAVTRLAGPEVNRTHRVSAP